MSYEKYYPNGWQSGQTGGTPITPEALNHMEQGIANLDSEKAPAGYGLGTNGETIADCHVSNSGFYRWDGNCANAPFNYATMLNLSRYGSVGSKLAFCNGGSTRGVMALKTGTEEWEYINPPMIATVEYRTTERYNGKVVYTKLFNTGELTNGGTFDFTDLDVTTIRYTATGYGHTLPYYGGGTLGGVWSIWCDITGKQFMGFLGSGMTACDFTVQVWYTKD